MTEEPEIGDTEDRGIGAPMLLIVPGSTPSDDKHRLLDRLQEDYGYGIMLEHNSEHQAVYTIAPGFYDEEEDSSNED